MINRKILKEAEEMDEQEIHAVPLMNFRDEV